jgi:hypothetical protein
MRILIQPSADGYGFDRIELDRALEALRGATVPVEVAAVVGLQGLKHGLVVLRAKADTARALVVLKQAGMRASV